MNKKYPAIRINWVFTIGGGLERLCLSWHKALQEVRGVVVLVHLL